MRRHNVDRYDLHYDRVTMAWRYIFGDHFHLGYFFDPALGLDRATLALNEALLAMGRMDKNAQVLDVGCGIGSPALFLNEKTGCSVTGISTSGAGVALANARSREAGRADRVRFLVADGIDNRLPAAGFDVVWLMESSHTMKDKTRLFEECFRTLRPGGRLLLADVMPGGRSRTGYFVDCLWKKGLAGVIGRSRMKRAFGPAWTETSCFYQALLEKIGFRQCAVEEIGIYVRPTFACWRKNAIVNQREIRQYFSRRELNDFLAATDVVEDWYASGLLGYGLISAVKLG